MKALSKVVCIVALIVGGESTTWARGEAGAPTGIQQVAQSMAPDVAKAFERLGKQPSTLSLQAALQVLARKFPERVVLEIYGKSLQGRSLYRLRVIPWDADLDRAKHGQPAVVLVADLEAPVEPGLILGWIHALAAAQVQRDNLELVFYPVPDPDRWVAGVRHGADNLGTCLERNFPVGWMPWQAGHASPGSLPLSEPETRSLAASLVAMPEVVGLVLLGAKTSGTPKAMSAGSLQRYAAQGLGLAVVQPLEESTASWERALEWIEASRPRLQVEVVSSKRLSQQLWLVECQVRNGGRHRTGAPSPKVQVQVSGARCLKLAWANEVDGPFEVIATDAIPAMPKPGAVVGLRLVLRVTDPSATILHLNSPRLNGSRLALIVGGGIAVVR